MLRTVYPNVWLVLSHVFFIVVAVYLGLLDFFDPDTKPVLVGTIPLIICICGFLFLQKYNQGKPYPDNSARFWLVLAIILVSIFVLIGVFQLTVGQASFGVEFLGDVAGRTIAGIFGLCLLLLILSLITGDIEFPTN